MISWSGLNPYTGGETYVYKDYGAGYFTDFVHKFNINIQAETGTYNFLAGIAYANGLGDAGTHYSNNWDWLGFAVYDDNTLVECFQLREVENGNQHVSNYYTITVGNDYWIEITKSGTSVDAKIYSDSGFSNLLDTLELTLQADHSFHYIQAVSGFSIWNQQDGYTSGYVHNLEI